MTRTLNRLGNAKQVAALRDPGWHADGGGLYLRILPTGSRRWVFVDQSGGKRKETALGVYPDVSLAEARAKRDAPADRAPAAAITFGEFADQILPTFLPGFKNAKHRQQWENTLKTHAASLRPIPINRVSTDDVLAVLRPIWLTKNETASRLRGRIERILGAAKAAGHRPKDAINPATWDDHLEHFLGTGRQKQKRHHAAMPYQDIPSFIAQLRNNVSTSALALEFCILTWTRTNETIGARWREFGAETWTIPGERMKLGKDHTVPLTPRMKAILADMGPGAPDDFVFPGRKGGPLSNMAMLMLVRRHAPGLTVHGFRSAARDWAGDCTNHPREIAEMALAHAVGSDVEQAYRRGTALAKRRVLMEEWETYLASTTLQ